MRFTMVLNGRSRAYSQRRMAVTAAMLALTLCCGLGTATAGVNLTYPGTGVLVANPFQGKSGLSLLPVGSLTGNQVTVNSGTLGYAYGAGSTGAETLSGNTLTINGGTARFDVFGAFSELGAATGNTLVINGGSVRSAYGAQADKAVTNTSLTLNGGSTSGSAAAGWSIHGAATGNALVINGGTVGNDAYGGQAAGGHATGNTVTINGGRVERNVYGGFAVAAGNAASGNNVRILGGHVEGDVVAGYSHAATATNNTVTIGAGATFSPRTSLLGGEVTTGGGDQRSGNTLNVQGWRGSIAQVSNFENYTFTLPSGIAAGDTMLTLTSANSTNLDNTTVRHTGIMGGGTLFNAGDSVNLLKNTAGVSTTGINLAGGTVQQGVSLLYQYDLAATANAVTMTFTSTPELLPQTTSVAQGRAASLGVVNMGGDLAAGAGMDNARQAASSGLSGGDSRTPWGMAVFAAGSIGSMHYNVGNGVDLQGSAIMLGLAKTWRLAPVDIMVGAFFETGSSFSDSKSAGVSNSGTGNYTGGGILARLDVIESVLQGLYLEASVRTGTQYSKNEGDGLASFAGSTTSYDTESPYVGFHAGLGYIWNFTDKAALDIYGKYFWTHQYGSTVRIAGDPFKFKDADSQRIRAGGRFSYAVTDWLRPYIGAAYEHEFDGKSRVTTYGFDIPAPGLKGGTGVGELGLNFTPGFAQGVSVDLGVQGYTGVRQGVTGSLQLKFEF